MSFSLRKRWAALPYVALAVALSASGCSSGDGGSSAPVDRSVLGQENKATGAPIKLGFVTTGPRAPVHTEELEVAKATVAYVNTHLGGINGRPIELITCEDEIQVSLARNCANKFVQSDAVAVVTGDYGNSDTIATITSPSAMPYFALAGGGQAMVLPNTYVMGNPLNGLIGVPAAYAKQNGYKKIAVLTVDSPVAVEPLTKLGPLAFGNAGAQADVVAIPLGTADMTPQIQAALEKKPDMFHLLGDVSFCAAAIKAMRTLNATQPVMTVNQCVGDSEIASQIPGGYQDLLVVANSVVDPASKETKLFEAVVDGSGAEMPDTAAAPYMAILGLRSALDGMAGEITRATVAARLGSMAEPEPLPLTPASTFQCGTKPISFGPNICSGNALLGKAEEDGSVVDVKTIDTTAVFATPGR
ncbi:MULTISPECIES: ABC transporter substrate-binding protein [unclassified Nocardia]|uniref:ABC transporter substrate-binding protein n=1 Tax=Nocardia sp. NPDC060220 TaxID=3347076 RepID=UPI00365E92E4